jgi:hypothetical protein
MPRKLGRHNPDFAVNVLDDYFGVRVVVRSQELCDGHSDTPGCIVMTPLQLETLLQKMMNLIALLPYGSAPEDSSLQLAQLWRHPDDPPPRIAPGEARARRHRHRLLRELAACRLFLRHTHVVVPPPKQPLEYADAAAEAFTTLVPLLMRGPMWEIKGDADRKLWIRAIAPEGIMVELSEPKEKEPMKVMLPSRYVECRLRIIVRGHNKYLPGVRLVRRHREQWIAGHDDRERRRGTAVDAATRGPLGHGEAASLAPFW